jgi:hypothetical protein
MAAGDSMMLGRQRQKIVVLRHNLAFLASGKIDLLIVRGRTHANE